MGVDKPSIRPRLLLNFELVSSTQSLPSSVAAARCVRIDAITAELRQVTSAGEVYIGSLFPRNMINNLFISSRTGFTLGLDLNHYELREMEKLRESKDIQFAVNMSVTGGLEIQPQARDSCNFQIKFRIPKSDWVENYLPSLGIKTVSLIEIPQLMDAEFAEAIGHVDDAWKQYSMGEYHRVLTDCRKALESLSAKIKSKGFEKEVSDEGEKKKVPDWGKFLDSDEFGDIVGTINKKIFGFASLGSHAGKSINKEDADFALMTTHAMVNFIIRKYVLTCT